MPSSPYRTILPDWRSRLERCISQQNLSKRKLSLLAGLGETTVSEWFNPRKNKQPSFSSLAAVAGILRVSLDEFIAEDISIPSLDGDGIASTTIAYAAVLGELRAGSWQEANVHVESSNKTAPTFYHPGFEGVEQYAWRILSVLGGKEDIRGSFVIGVKFSDIIKFRVIKNEDLVVCRRKRDDLTEYTLRRVFVVNGEIWLRPELLTEHQHKDVKLVGDPHSDAGDVAATHLIIGSYQFFA